MMPWGQRLPKRRPALDELLEIHPHCQNPWSHHPHPPVFGDQRKLPPARFLHKPQELAASHPLLVAPGAADQTGTPWKKYSIYLFAAGHKALLVLQRGFSLNVTHPVALILVSYHSGTLTYVKRNYQYWWYNLLVVIYGGGGGYGYSYGDMVVMVMVMWWLWVRLYYHYGVGTVQSMLANTCLKRKQWLIRGTRLTCLRYMIGLPQNKNNLVGSRPLEEIFYLLQRGFSLNVTHPVALILVSYHSGTLTYDIGFISFWDPYLCQEELPVLMV